MKPFFLDKRIIRGQFTPEIRRALLEITCVVLPYPSYFPYTRTSSLAHLNEEKCPDLKREAKIIYFTFTFFRKIEFKRQLHINKQLSSIKKRKKNIYVFLLFKI